MAHHNQTEVIQRRFDREVVMANDPPTNLRMGFGFIQARAAGAPYVQPRSAWKMDWDVKNRQCKKKLNDLAKRYPPIGKLVKEIIEARKAQAMPLCSAVELYHVVLLNRPGLAPCGYWDYAKKTFGYFPPQSK